MAAAMLKTLSKKAISWKVSLKLEVGVSLQSGSPGNQTIGGLVEGPGVEAGLFGMESSEKDALVPPDDPGLANRSDILWGASICDGK